MYLPIHHPTWPEVLSSNPDSEQELKSLIQNHLHQMFSHMVKDDGYLVHLANLEKRYHSDVDRMANEGIAPEDIEAPDFYWLCGAYQEATGKCHLYGSCPYPAKEIYERFLGQQASSADKNKAPA